MSAQTEKELEESSELETYASTSLNDSPPHTPPPEESLEPKVNESADVSLLRCKIKAMQEEIVGLRDALQQEPQQQEELEGQELRKRFFVHDKLVAHKYVQLLKKLRNQNVELYIAQNKAQKLTQEVEALQNEKQMADHNTRRRKEKNSKHEVNHNNKKNVESKNNHDNGNGIGNDDDNYKEVNDVDNNKYKDEKDKELVERLQRQLHSVTMHNDLLKRQTNELIEVVKDEVGFGANYSKEKILQWTRRHCNRVSSNKNTCSGNNTVVAADNDDDDDDDSNITDGCKVKYIHGWKGRAAQIVLLQSKLKEYERELRTLRLQNANQNVEDKVNNKSNTDKTDSVDNIYLEQEYEEYSSYQKNSNIDSNSNYTNDTSMQQIAEENFDDRTRERLAQIQGNKLAALRDVEAQLAQVKDELAHEKNNGKAYQARFSNLQQECVQLRNYVKTLLDKSKSDDTLIDAYKTEIKLLQSSLYKAKEEIAFYSTTTENTYCNDSSSNNNRKEKITISANDDALCNSLSNHNNLLAKSLTPDSSAGVMISERDALLLRWVHRLLELDPTVELTTLTCNNNNNNNSHSAMQKVVWIAHSHVLRLEEQMQSTYHITLINLVNRVNELIEQVSRGNKATSEVVAKEVKNKLVASVDTFILTENKQLKERIRSLVELNRAEGKVFEHSTC